jgi:uncharacterized peroxidase-related enzyme
VLPLAIMGCGCPRRRAKQHVQIQPVTTYLLDLSPCSARSRDLFYIEGMAYTIPGVAPAQNAALAEIEKKTGPSNFFRTMAHRPEAMRDFASFYGALMGPSGLERRIKEMIYLAVSYVNECTYCGSHHVKTALNAGLTEAEIREIEMENNQHFSPKEQAALHYARELTRTASVDDDTRYRAQELFSSDQFVELTMIVSLANFTNRFNNGLAVPVEE